MNLYEIDGKIKFLLDQVDEYGVMSDETYGEFETLMVEKSVKIENTALYYKNIIAETKAIKEEEDKLRDRRKAKENYAERLKVYLGQFLDGEKFESAKVKIGYRKSTAVVLIDEDKIPADFRVPQPDKIAKSEIGKAIKEGKEVPGAALEERESIQVR